MTVLSQERIAADLSTPLSIASSFRFPLQSRESRREVLWGAALLVLLPGVGWLLNMGHRIVMVHRMQQGQSAWPAWLISKIPGAKRIMRLLYPRMARHRHRLSGACGFKPDRRAAARRLPVSRSRSAADADARRNPGPC